MDAVEAGRLAVERDRMEALRLEALEHGSTAEADAFHRCANILDRASIAMLRDHLLVRPVPHEVPCPQPSCGALPQEPCRTKPPEQRVRKPHYARLQAWHAAQTQAVRKAIEETKP